MSTILSPRKRVGLTQFRAVLLASAAAAALCLSPARPAQADCSFLRASQEIICTGDVSDGANFWQLPGGVKIATDYAKLTVHDVTGDITPAPGRAGRGSRSGQLPFDRGRKQRHTLSRRHHRRWRPGRLRLQLI